MNRSPWAKLLVDDNASDELIPVEVSRLAVTPVPISGITTVFDPASSVKMMLTKYPPVVEQAVVTSR